ncbi:DUF1467 family protein [Mesorhizobium muleiense]|uniref:DUF1467 family protein n=1 Tax=Mesorhizobium TaxID=68287 RepID=UPI000FEA655B|nr:DUF1467 family protein [Mesorhizobium sp.]RWP20852.1 MAG: DUF1467 family protein [Mesorhizobium sp.]
MSWVSFLALFFITWWVVLFAILPFSLRTQDEDEDVTLGTVSSAPRGPHMLRAVLRTTIVTLVLLGVFYGMTRGLGLGIDDIPHIVPDFSRSPEN